MNVRMEAINKALAFLIVMMTLMIVAVATGNDIMAIWLLVIGAILQVVFIVDMAIDREDNVRR